jgi:pimeloyl-ACP methyl ester carboxylesterase
VRQYPVWVPFGRDRLAAVIDVPDGEPRGLVMLLTGGSAARSHRFRVWTRTARRLAEEQGLASVRFDYRGTGDSTGELRQWRMSQMPVDQVVAVLRFSMDALSVDRVALTGNCLGARLALAAGGATPEALGALCIRAPILEPSRIGKASEAVGRTSLGQAIRRAPTLRRVARALAGERKKKKTSLGAQAPMQAILQRGRLMFLYSQDDFTFNQQVLEELEAIASRLPADQRTRYELRVLTGGNLKGFESLEIQRQIIDIVVEWMAKLYRDAAAEPAQGGLSPVPLAE